MDKLDLAKDVLTLQSVPGVFNRTIKKLRETEPSLAPRDWLERFVAQEKIDPSLLRDKEGEAERDVERTRQQGVHVVTLWDEDYPELLLEIADPPSLLFFLGQLPQKSVNYCLVGTRNPSGQTRHWTEKIVRHLSEQTEVAVVSGLARGVDSWAHQFSLKYRVPTYAVLGSGVEQVYPWENKGLAQKIVAEGGGLVSEFLPWTEAAKYRFPQRNRIMSGLSQATLLLEAGRKSGALGTCHWALEHNRELFVLPPIFDSEKFLGNAYMIQQGATLLSRLEDLSLTEARQPSLFGQWTDLSPAQQRIMPKVSENGIHKEDLAQLLGWELPELELELFRLTQQGLLLEGRNNFIFRRENL